MNDTTTISRELLVHIDLLPDDVTTYTPVVLPAAETPALVYLARMLHRSRPVMFNALKIAVEMVTISNPLRFDVQSFPWWLLRYNHVEAIRAILIETRSLSTANRVLSAVRGVLKTCWRMRLISTEDYQRAIDVDPIKGNRLEQAAGRMLSPGELASLLGVCNADPSPAGCRDAAMIGLAAYAGLRRQEIADLTLDAWHTDSQTLHVRGKGNKLRTVPLTAGLVDALADWLHLRGNWPGALFVPINKGGRLGHRPMADQSFADVLEKRRQQAAIGSCSPHDLRRSFISNLLDAGADLSVVQRLAGHSSTETTASYDRRGERAKHEAVARLHISYPRRFA